MRNTFNFNGKIENLIAGANIVIGNGNVMNNDNRTSVYVQSNTKQLDLSCDGCGAIVETWRIKCSYCGRVNKNYRIKVQCKLKE
jgi:hypothetical protein